MASRIQEIGQLSGAISEQHFGCVTNRSAMDGLLLTLTTRQGWQRQTLPQNSTHSKEAPRPSILTNDIDREFNCVIFLQLEHILRHDGLHEELVRLIASIGSDRQLQCTFDGDTETAQPFLAGLPQPSPLWPILFVIYASGLNAPKVQSSMEQETSYVDDDLMLQGATSQGTGSSELQRQVNDRIARAPRLNICYAPRKCELIHLKPYSSHKKDDPSACVSRYGQITAPKPTIKTVGVWLDSRLSLRTHAASASAATRQGNGLLWRIAKQKKAFPGALHHLSHTTIIPKLLWGLEAWWTGGAHILAVLCPS